MFEFQSRVVYSCVVCLVGATTLGGAQAQTQAEAEPAISFTPYVLFQLDGGATDGSGSRPDEAVNLRRGRLGLTAEVGDFSSTLIGELGGTAGSRPQVYEASVRWSGDLISLEAGIFEPNFMLEPIQSDSELLFMESAAVVGAGTSVAGGSSRFAAEVSSGGERWLAAVALTGGQAGPDDDRDHRGMTARIAGLAISEGGFDLHLGLSGSHSWRLQREDGIEGIAFGANPELTVDDWSSPLGTEFLAASRASVASAELGASYGRWWWQGEATHIAVRRPDASDAALQGFYVQSAYLLIGQPRSWQADTATWSGPDRTDMRFNPASGEWGAIELAARYSLLDLDDASGGRQQVGSAGVNWWPQDPFRVNLQAQRVHIDRVAEPTRFWQFGGRLQVSF